jgi:hypothetical protein
MTSKLTALAFAFCLAAGPAVAFQASTRAPLADRIAQLERSKSSKERNTLARALANETRGRAALARLAMDTRDSRLRSTIFDALAQEAGSSGLRLLARIHAEKEDTQRRQILRALRNSPHDGRTLYRSFAAPCLGKNETSTVQLEALRLLADKGDRRFFDHLEELFELSGMRGSRNELTRLAARLDGVRAIQALLPFVEARVQRAEDSFLQHMPSMRDPSASAWFRKRGTRHFDAVVRRTALRQIQRTVGASDLSLLSDMARDEEPEVAAEAVRAVALLPGEEALDTLLAIADRGTARAAPKALRELFARKDGRTRALDFCLSTIASYRPAELRIAAIDLIEESHATPLENELLAASTDRDSRVRIAAYRALTFVRHNRSVEHLLERLASEQGTAQHFLLEALRDLTGHDQGNDPESWFTWWELVKESFVVGPKKAPKKQAVAVRGRTTAQYYGIDIVARRLAFIIDLSGSMRAKVEGKTRLAHAKTELIRALEKLPQETWFNIVPFSDDPEPWRPQLVRATARNIKEAIEYVQGLRIGNWTNIYDSLELCLEMEGIESIFLLSDGGPSIGKFVAKPAIRDEVRERNMERRIRVHTIMIGGSKADRAFMKRLAEENHGKNVDR